MQSCLAGSARRPIVKVIASWLAVFFLASGFLAARASATDFPVLGFPGDKTAEVRCEANTYVIGFRGRIGSWIDKLAPVCAWIDTNGVRGEAIKGLAMRGGTGGRPFETRCAGNQFVMGVLIAALVKAKTIGELNSRCSGGDENLLVGDFDQVGMKKVEAVHACSSGEAAVGLVIQYGKHVNGLALLCGPLVLSEGNNRAVGFNGVWDSVVEGQPYVITLKVNGTDITGDFVHQDNRYTGRIRGTLQSEREMIYTYEQNNGAVGSGIFILSSYGNNLSGKVGANGVTHVWNAKRQQ